MQIPHSRDAEESLLSCCIKGGEDLVFERVQSSLSTEDFYFEEHQQIWDTLNELSESNTPIDIVTVTELAKGKNDELVHTVINLDCLNRSTLVLPEYVKIVLDQSKLRTLRREYTLALDKISANTSPDEIVDAVNEEIDKLKPQEKDTTHIKHSLDIIRDEYDRMASGEYKHEYVLTHLKHLDDKIKLELGCVFTIAAPTSVGKSALSLNIALRAASKDKFPTLIFSLEMPQKQITKRMIGTLSNLDLKRTEELVETPENRAKIDEAMDKLNNIPLHTIHSVKSINSLASDVRRYKKEKGIKLVVIDYLQLIPFNSNKMGKADGIAQISQKVKQIALENDIAIILLSQLNREGARSDRPDLYHLKDSGSIENDADIVLIMNCKDNDPESAKTSDSHGPYMHINYLIAKNREGERGLRDNFKFYFKEGRFF